MNILVAVLTMAALFVLYGVVTLVRGSHRGPRCGSCGGDCDLCDRPENLEEHSHGAS